MLAGARRRTIRRIPARRRPITHRRLIDESATVEIESPWRGRDDEREPDPHERTSDIRALLEATLACPAPVVDLASENEAKVQVWEQLSDALLAAPRAEPSARPRPGPVPGSKRIPEGRPDRPKRPVAAPRVVRTPSRVAGRLERATSRALASWGRVNVHVRRAVLIVLWMTFCSGVTLFVRG